MHWSFPVVRIFGITVRMHWFMAIMAVAWILQGAVALQSYFGFMKSMGFTAITVAILLVTILLHELCHCWMAWRLGGGADQILLWPLGGLAFVQFPSTPANQIKVSAVGPLSNFVMGGGCLGILMLTGVPWHWGYLIPFEEWWPMGFSLTQYFILHAVKINIILGLFNLVVPAYPLDGGKILMMALTLRWGKYRAAEITAFIAIPVGIAMVIFGLSMNDLILVLIGAWVMFEAFQLRRLVRMGELEAHPAFHGVGEHEFLPDPMIKIRAASRERRPGFFARWRAKRAKKRIERESRRAAEIEEKVEGLLEKVSREGIGSLTASERAILDEASRRRRGG